MQQNKILEILLNKEFHITGIHKCRNYNSKGMLIEFDNENKELPDSYLSFKDLIEILDSNNIEYDLEYGVANIEDNDVNAFVISKEQAEITNKYWLKTKNYDIRQ